MSNIQSGIFSFSKFVTRKSRFVEMVTAKKFIYAQKFEGMPKLTDMVLEEEELPDLEEEQFLAQALYWSVDPYTRCLLNQFPSNVTMVGSQIAE